LPEQIAEFERDYENPSKIEIQKYLKRIDSFITANLLVCGDGAYSSRLEKLKSQYLVAGDGYGSDEEEGLSQ